ncbi:Ras-related protein Rab-9B [Oopsacas minuta]|uniref:Ras-related protein Rab-9B n=1 Tax=Oopsacas minuta TaxID=111878 RepID=A0AAV7KJB9_9METZ|nr:Ras-related protein Rab-9B [Oopsacas minuta]
MAYTPYIQFVGCNGVGKTTLIGKLSGHDVNTENTKPTIKSDYVNKQLIIGSGQDRRDVNVRLYDQQFDMFASPRSIFRQSDIIILVWSMDDTQTFRSIDEHLKSIYNIYDSHKHHRPDIVLCANKCDASRNDNEYKLCKAKYKIHFVAKTSARDGTGINLLESELCKILAVRFNIISEERQTDSVTVSIGPIPRPDFRCC